MRWGSVIAARFEGSGKLTFEPGKWSQGHMGDPAEHDQTAEYMKLAEADVLLGGMASR